MARSRCSPGSGARLIQAVLVTLGLAGCTGASSVLDDTRLLAQGEENLTPAERELLVEAKRFASTRMKGAGVGAAGGGLVGALGGALASDDAAGAVIGALVGATAGGFAGYAGGAYVAEANRQASSRQTDLRARIAAVDTDIARYEAANAAATQVIAQRRVEIEGLNEAYAAGAIDQAAYERELDGVETSILSLKSLTTEARGNYELLVADPAAQGPSEDASALTARREQLAAEQTLLEAQLDELLAVVDTVPSEIAVAGREERA